MDKRNWSIGAYFTLDSLVLLQKCTRKVIVASFCKDAGSCRLSNNRGALQLIESMGSEKQIQRINQKKNELLVIPHPGRGHVCLAQLLSMKIWYYDQGHQLWSQIGDTFINYGNYESTDSIFQHHPPHEHPENKGRETWMSLRSQLSSPGAPAGSNASYILRNDSC